MDREARGGEKVAEVRGLAICRVERGGPDLAGEGTHYELMSLILAIEGEEHTARW